MNYIQTDTKEDFNFLINKLLNEQQNINKRNLDILMKSLEDLQQLQVNLNIQIGKTMRIYQDQIVTVQQAFIQYQEQIKKLYELDINECQKNYDQAHNLQTNFQDFKNILQKNLSNILIEKQIQQFNDNLLQLQDPFEQSETNLTIEIFLKNIHSSFKISQCQIMCELHNNQISTIDLNQIKVIPKRFACQKCVQEYPSEYFTLEQFKDKINLFQSYKQRFMEEKIQEINEAQNLNEQLKNIVLNKLQSFKAKIIMNYFDFSSQEMFDIAEQLSNPNSFESFKQVCNQEYQLLISQQKILIKNLYNLEDMQMHSLKNSELIQQTKNQSTFENLEIKQQQINIELQCKQIQSKKLRFFNLIKIFFLLLILIVICNIQLNNKFSNHNYQQNQIQDWQNLDKETVFQEQQTTNIKIYKDQYFDDLITGLNQNLQMKELKCSVDPFQQAQEQHQKSKTKECDQFQDFEKASSEQKYTQTKEFDGVIWDYTFITPIQFRTKFMITSTKNQQLKYILDGQIIRIDHYKDTSQKLQIMTNLEQIKYLSWIGEYGIDNQKIKNWMGFWKGEILANVGGMYSNDGKKQGLWVELINNYWSKANVYEVGEYINNKRIGKWKYIYQNNEIGGGFYDDEGQKTGDWIELSDGFCSFSQVTYHGEYQNNKKVGRWETFYKERFQNEVKLIGGGSYMETGQSSIKVGSWIEQYDRFSSHNQIIYVGDYQNGKKIGRWDIFYENELIGGGQYEVIEEISIKVGKWIELSDTFASDSQVGKYENGIKVGRWDIYNKKSQKNLKIGGGMYIQVGGESKKNGIWIELNEQFRYLSQVTLKGFYSAGKKVGKWKIFFNHILIGGGSYIEQGSFKFGSWCELSIGFSEQSQVVYVGDYQNGKKVGSWDIFYQEELIGGGQYEVIEEISIKVGKWIELSDNFSDYSQVIYVGEYQNGKKIGRWDIQVRMENEFNFQQIGGGQYEEVDEVSNKVGRWCELSIGFSEYSKVVYVGDYQNGKKVGRWDIFYKEELIGGGSYVQIEQGSIKNGSWSELDDYFDDDLQYINHGEYRMGKKVGTWIQIDLDYDNYYKETKYDI